MKLTVENIGRIHRSEIRLDGLTVVAGPNNGGKSTLGEALFALANSQFDFPKKVVERNEIEIRRAIQECLWVHTPDFRNEREQRFSMDFRSIDFLSSEMASYFLSANDVVSENEVRSWLKSFPDIARGKINEKKRVHQPRKLGSLNTIVNILCASDEQAKQFRLTCVKLFNDKETTLRRYFARNYFESLFSGQYESVNCPEDESTMVSLKTDGSNPRGITIDFANGACKNVSVNLASQEYVLFIDDPNLLDRVTSSRWHGDAAFGIVRSGVKSEQFAQALRRKMLDKTRVWTADDRETYEAKCEKIINVLETAHKGNISSTDEGGVVLEEFGSDEQILLQNVSVGVKAIELLKELLKRGALDENTFLVLDEPEIHLHPEWQIIYAHALVMIADLLHTKVLVTTHSPYFIQAIDVYTTIQENTDMVHTYTPHEYSQSAVDFVEVSGEQKQQILDKMAEPFDALQRLLLEYNL